MAVESGSIRPPVETNLVFRSNSVKGQALKEAVKESETGTLAFKQLNKETTGPGQNPNRLAIGKGSLQKPDTKFGVVESGKGSGIISVA